MSAGVLDASVALAWCFEDEASAACDALLDMVRDQGATVPGLWHLEVANVLLQAERRGRITREQVAARIELFGALPISVDVQTVFRAWQDTLALAREERLTPYDAAYLELARRTNQPLMTRDADLVRAASRLRIGVLPAP